MWSPRLPSRSQGCGRRLRSGSAHGGAEKPSGSWSFLFYAHPVITEAGASTARTLRRRHRAGRCRPHLQLLPKPLQTNSIDTAAAGTPAPRPTPPSPSRARGRPRPRSFPSPTFDPPSQPLPLQARRRRLRPLPQGNETAGSSCPLPSPCSPKATHPNPSRPPQGGPAGPLRALHQSLDIFQTLLGAQCPRPQPDP